MSDQASRLLVTGASGQLGGLVIDAILTRAPEARISALVRRKEAGEALAARGVDVRMGDYSDAASLEKAFVGVDRLLLIASNEVGQRAAQHRNVIDAAKKAGVALIVATSLLHADSSVIGLGNEYRDTEAYLRASGVPFLILRNGWYTENYTAPVQNAVAHGVRLTAAGAGRVNSAARKDYAEAAATVLLKETVETGRVYELAGDESFSQDELAAEVARLSGRTVEAKHVSLAEFEQALIGTGMPPKVAALYADFEKGTAAGALADDGRELRRLIGRPTTRWQDTVAGVVKG
ncbi:MAG: SDR family oxidoreductase [Methylobacterium mesophilicum]|nr:SDR family oxidoreductase [Methylobacterium mesophilicum]